MHSAVFIICIPLVVMVTSDVTAGQRTTTTTTTPTPTETFADDDDEPSEKKTVEPLECSVVSEQREQLSQKLGDLGLQLKQLMNAMDKINLSAPAENISRSECPPGFIDSVDSCYRVVSDNLPWSLAALRCQSLHPHAHLVTIGNDLEQRSFDTIINNLDNETLKGCWCDRGWSAGVGLWTGGQRLHTAGLAPGISDFGEYCNSPFVWKKSACSVSEMSYSNWCSGQPDFWRGQESCAHIFKFATSNATCWNDIYCGTKMCFVCEIDRSDP